MGHAVIKFFFLKIIDSRFQCNLLLVRLLPQINLLQQHHYLYKVYVS